MRLNYYFTFFNIQYYLHQESPKCFLCWRRSGGIVTYRNVSYRFMSYRRVAYCIVRYIVSYRIVSYRVVTIVSFQLQNDIIQFRIPCLTDFLPTLCLCPPTSVQNNNLGPYKSKEHYSPTIIHTIFVYFVQQKHLVGPLWASIQQLLCSMRHISSHYISISMFLSLFSLCVAAIRYIIIHMFISEEATVTSLTLPLRVNKTFPGVCVDPRPLTERKGAH